MWWDGGERAITAREKARIEEHGPSCFSIALVPATPSARWAADALADPHGDRYACERAALTLGNLTDDELANAVFLHGNEQPTMADLAAGKALAGIVYLTAAKERIRWLSRALVDATCKQPLQVGEVQGDARAQFEAWAKGEGWKDDQLTRYSGGRCTTAGEYHNSHLEALWYGWKSALAARQPGAQEPVGFQIMRRSADDTCFNGRWDNPPSGFHDDREYYVSRSGTYRIRDIYVAPPAQADHPYQRITGLQGIGDAADYLARHPGDDYAHRHLSERVMEFCQKHGVSPAQGIDLWQPIDTAPDDLPADEAVLVCVTHDEPRFAGQRMVGEAYKVEGVWWWAGSGPGDYTTDPIEDLYGLGCVTHWRPMPDAPLIDQRDAGHPSDLEGAK
jgi:hypothetical protein